MRFKLFIESKGIRFTPQMRRELRRVNNSLSKGQDDTIGVFNPYTQQVQQTPVKRKDLEGYGVFRGNKREIEIANGLDNEKRQRTIDHEFAHSIDPKGQKVAQPLPTHHKTKQCPKCQKHVNSASSNCYCGYEFEDGVWGKPYKGQSSAYLKSPQELDANTASINEEIYRYVKNIIKNTRQNKFFTDDSLDVLIALEDQIKSALKVLSGNKSEFQKSIFSKLSDDIPYFLGIYLLDVAKSEIGPMPKDTKRRFITRIYHACVEALERIEKEKQRY